MVTMQLMIINMTVLSRLSSAYPNRIDSRESTDLTRKFLYGTTATAEPFVTAVATLGFPGAVGPNRIERYD